MAYSIRFHVKDTVTTGRQVRRTADVGSSSTIEVASLPLSVFVQSITLRLLSRSAKLWQPLCLGINRTLADKSLKTGFSDGRFLFLCYQAEAIAEFIWSS